MITELFAIDERINTPGSTHSHNWSFRLPWSLEQIRADQRLSEICRKFTITISLTRGKAPY
jgi:4-alpha-glucanotransferase